MSRACISSFCFVLVLILFLSAPDSALGAGAEGLQKEFRQSVWTTENGLPNNMVLSSLQTRDGYFWIGTYTGLVRFDGLKFTVFNHENSPLPKTEGRMPLVEDADGNLWIGTAHGLFRYKDGRFTRFTPRDGLWDEEIVALHLGKSWKLWIATGGGLNLFDNGSVKRIPTADWPGRTDKTVLKVCEDNSGFLWIVTIWSIEKFEIKTGKSAIVFHSSEGVPQRSVHIDPQGKIWFGGYAALWQLRDGQWIRYPQPNDGASGPINTVITDHEGSLWFSTGITGLGRLAQGSFSYFNSRSGLPDDWISGVREDREGNLWLGTIKAGLVRWQRRPFTTYTTADGLPDNIVNTICEGRDGSVWIGTERGLCRFQDGQFTAVDRAPGPTSNIRAIVEDSTGTLWIGTLGAGVDGFRNGQFANYRLPRGFEDNKVRALTIANDDSLWIGTAIDLHHLSNGKLTTITATNIGGAVHEVWEIHQDRNKTLWVGSYGVVGINSAALTNAIISSRDASVFTTTNGLSNPNVWAMYEDREGVLWVGTAQGLNRVKDGKIHAFTQREGLYDDRIDEILEDDWGNLWLGCNRAICRVRKAELMKVATGQASSVRCVAYDQRDGLPDARINGRKSQPGGCKTRDGRLWFPTTQGIVVIDPKKIIEHDSPPPVIIESVRANGAIVLGDVNAEGRLTSRVEAEDGRQKSEARSQGPEVSGGRGTSAFSASSAGNNVQPRIGNRKSEIRLLAADARVLEFDYTACDFAAAEKVHFKYRMEGFDRDWIEAGARRTAFYTNLRPGTYRFRVIACNHNGIWNDTGASFAFSLAPHYYQTSWFYGLCALAVSVAAYGVYRWRLAELRKIQTLEQQNRLALERTRIARDIHDDLGANLTQIGLLTALADRTLKSEHQAAIHLRKVSAAAGEIAQSVDEIVWAINPQHDTLRSALAYLRKYAAEYLENAGIKARLEWPPEIPSSSIAAQTRHHLFLVAKEALHNIVQHAEAGAVVARVSCERFVLSLVLEDDGRGFDVIEARDVGNGLANMKNRIAELGGQFELTSESGRGTQIVIKVPLEKDPSIPNK